MNHMFRPWQIWILFALCVGVVMAAMAWLTSITVQADRLRAENFRSTEVARQQAQLQERISSALWRLDFALTPLVAQEASRPYFVYQPFYQVAERADANGDNRRGYRWLPSPLRVDRSRYVTLYFQIEPDGRFLCPTCPSSKQVDKAEQAGLSGSTRQADCEQLRRAEQFCDFDAIMAKCSPQQLPGLISAAPLEQLPLVIPGESSASSTLPVAPFDNTYVDDWVQQNAGLPASDQDRQRDTPRQTFQSDRAQVQKEWNKQRVSQELQTRDQATKLFSQNQLLNNPQPATPAAEQPVRVGVMRPMWIDANLLLARQVDLGDRQVLQCCWLDWDRLQSDLKQQIEDVLPHAELRPVRAATESQVNNLLATLPIEVVATLGNLPAEALAMGAYQSSSNWFSGIRTPLWVAWTGVLLGAAAVGFLLHGVLQLSERRAAFVSAVTHELRTPLTTFRMYAEMLAEKMLPSDTQRQAYANTLRQEADRLSHLVENVLQFARLERGKRGHHRQPVAVGDLLQRLESRFVDRAQESNMQVDLRIEADVAEHQVRTDPTAIEHILFNLIDNACKYASGSEDRRIVLSCRMTPRHLLFLVRDFGPGIDRQKVRTLFQAFRKSDDEAANSAPGVGLGLALSRQLARHLGGDLTVARDPRFGDSKADDPTGIRPSDVSHGACFVLQIPAERPPMSKP